jgi:hypothetical protein
MISTMLFVVIAVIITGLLVAFFATIIWFTVVTHNPITRAGKARRQEAFRQQGRKVLERQRLVAEAREIAAKYNARL